MSDLKQFNLDLSKFKEKTKKDAVEFTQKVGLELFRKVRQRTYVDTGRAAGSWNINRLVADESVLPPAPPGTTGRVYPLPPLLTKTASLRGLQFGESIHISNNLDYIVELETQPNRKRGLPAGFIVASSVAEVEELANFRARSV